MRSIVIAGTPRPFCVTPRVLRNWMQEEKKGLNDLGNLSFTDLEVIFYHGFRSGHKVEYGQPADFTREQFADWMDQPDSWQTIKECQKELEQVMQAMADPEEANHADQGN